MINATFFIESSNKKIIAFEISGHAQDKTLNQDNLVCAGVSAIVFGILNSLDDKFLTIKVLENYINIEVNKDLKQNDIILNVLYKSLKTVEEENKKFIKISKKYRKKQQGGIENEI